MNENEIEEPNYVIKIESWVKASNMDEALTKVRDEFSKFRCGKLEIEVL